ncbi:MAG: hypothetical protein QM783_07200 [Phycisphaerales bacterium]
MKEPVRFSGSVWLPSPSMKPNILLALGFGLLVPLCVVAIAFSGVAIPPWLNPNTWGWLEYAVAAAVLAVPFILLTSGARRRSAKRARERMYAWCAETVRSNAEQAAADFYSSLWLGKRERGAAAAAFIAAVPAAQCRTIVTGDMALIPVDDGLLYEEADAFEGRISAAPRAILFLLGLPLVLQLLSVVMMGGINPYYWSINTWTRLTPAVINGVLLGLAYGLVRSPGNAAIVTPRRVQHAWMGRMQDFTADNSVMHVSSRGPQLTVGLYRNDGARSWFVYPSAEAAGFKQLINRWCMIAPGDTTAPLSPPVAYTTTGLSGVGSPAKEGT